MPISIGWFLHLLSRTALARLSLHVRPSDAGEGPHANQDRWWKRRSTEAIDPRSPTDPLSFSLSFSSFPRVATRPSPRRANDRSLESITAVRRTKRLPIDRSVPLSFGRPRSSFLDRAAWILASFFLSSADRIGLSLVMIQQQRRIENHACPSRSSSLSLRSRVIVINLTNQSSPRSSFSLINTLHATSFTMYNIN